MAQQAEMQSSVAADLTMILAETRGISDPHSRRLEQPDKVQSLLLETSERSSRRRTVIFVGLILAATSIAGTWLIARQPNFPATVTMQIPSVQNPVLPRDSGENPPQAFVKAATETPLRPATVKRTQDKVREHQVAVPAPGKSQGQTLVKSRRQEAARQPTEARVPINCARLVPETRSWCLRPALLAADKRLRRAYFSALAAGAGSRLISRYQRHWTKIRRQSDEAPQYVIDEYNTLARELESLSAGIRSGNDLR